MRKSCSSLAILLTCCSISSIAHAQNNGNSGAGPDAAQDASQASSNDSFGDIIVTADRTSSSVQKVPIAVTAVTGSDLAARGVLSVMEMQSSVPNLNLGTQAGIPHLALRGIGLLGTIIGQESQVAGYQNGVYLSRPAGFLSAFYDVDRVEVLRGPQGTLYGRNVIGGSVNVYTRAPTKYTEGYLTARYGNYNDVRLEGAVGGSLNEADTILQRVAFSMNAHDGYGKNLTTGQSIDNLRTISGRSTTVLKPTETFDVSIIADYNYQKDRSGQFQLIGQGGFTDEPGSPGIPVYGTTQGGKFALNSRNVYGDYKPEYRQKTWGILADANWDISDAVSIKSLTSYRYTNWFVNMTLDATSRRLGLWNQSENAKQVSQDLILSYTSDKLTWIVGGYFFHEKYIADQQVPLNPVGMLGELPGSDADVLTNGYYGGGRLKTTAFAVYTQATYNITDELSVTFGARQSTEKKKLINLFEFTFDSPNISRFGINPTASYNEDRWNSFTPKFGIQYQVDSDTLLYLSATKGFKSGSFNIGTTNQAVRPETLWSYEGGIKTTLLDRKLRMNLNGFYYDYKNLQVSVNTPDGTGLSFENAANTKSYGLEAEIIARPVDMVEFGGSFGWLHARYKNYRSLDAGRPSLGELDLSGYTPPQSPKYSGNIYAQYTLPINGASLTLRGENYFSAKFYFDQFDRDVLSQKAYSLQNLYLNAATDDGKWRASLYIKNIGNKLIRGQGYQASAIIGYPVIATYQAPRTYGISITREF